MNSEDSNLLWLFILGAVLVVYFVLRRRGRSQRDTQPPPEPSEKFSSAPARPWDWPTTDIHAGTKSASAVFENEVSGLGLFGYKVGKTQGWSQSKRQKFLSDFIELELPQIVSQRFGDKYGRPRSAKRLLAVANLIASLTRNAKRRNAHSMRYAIRDWEDDLAFLRARYYGGSGRRLRWPETD